MNAALLYLVEYELLIFYYTMIYMELASDPVSVRAKKSEKLENNNISFPSTLRPAGKWKSASDVSCILDTLSSSAIDSMAADMPAEVLITTECPKRDYTFSSKLVRQGRMWGDLLHSHRLSTGVLILKTSIL